MTGRDLPVWTRDERLARAAWSRLVEPGDAVAGAALSVLGACEALEVVLRERALPGRVGGVLGGRAPSRRLDLAVSRWRTRTEQLDPERDVATVGRLGGRLVVPSDEEWPGRLDELGLTAPPALWVLGRHDVAGTVQRSLAVVGARACTGYGQHVAAEVGAGVAEHGVTVVSGAAFGIDAAAHKGALAAAGSTVAVLACGVDRYYPQAHEPLLRHIAERGLVVAEVPPGSAPMRSRFLQRNRLIAALTSATLVVEAAWRSGALATASCAATTGRPLGAVPGPVTSAASAGCHRIMRDLGAVCVTDAAEALELVEPIGALMCPGADGAEGADGAAAPQDGLTEVDLRVLDALPLRRGVTVAKLAGVAGVPAQELRGSLARLHIAGLAATLAADGDRVWRRAGVVRPRRSGA